MATPDQLAALDLAKYQQFHEIARARMKEISALSTLGLRSILLLSGGAIVSLFTLLGHAENLAFNGQLLWSAFALFAASLACAMVATFLAFFSQNSFLKEEWSMADTIFWEVAKGQPQPQLYKSSQVAKFSRPAAIVTAMCAVAFFILGGAAALFAVSYSSPSALCDDHRPQAKATPIASVHKLPYNHAD